MTKIKITDSMSPTWGMDAQTAAIFNCLEQIIMSLSYQPDIPEQHKIDMVNSLGKVAQTYYETPIHKGHKMPHLMTDRGELVKDKDCTECSNHD